MEAAAGKPFLSYEQEQVFTPLGLSTRALISPPTSFRKGALLFRRQRRAHAQLDVRGQQLQMGWRRIHLHFRRSRAIRLGAVPARLSESRVARDALHSSKTKDEETNYEWLVYRQIKIRQADFRAQRRLCRRDFRPYPLSRYAHGRCVCMHYDGESWKGEEVQALAEAFEKIGETMPNGFQGL